MQHALLYPADVCIPSNSCLPTVSIDMLNIFFPNPRRLFRPAGLPSQVRALGLDLGGARWVEHESFCLVV